MNLVVLIGNLTKDPEIKTRKGYPAEKALIQPTFLLSGKAVYVCPVCCSELCRTDAKRKPHECKACGQEVIYQ